MNLKVPNISAPLHTARRFVGLDAYHAPQDLAEGMLTQADNVFVQGSDLVLRPGFAGQFSAPGGSPLYARLAYLNADGTTGMILESGGRVYQAAKGATSATEITFPGSGTLNSAGSRWARAARYGYRVDGTAPLLRTDLTGATVAMALATQPPAPSAALTSAAIDALTGGTWQPDTLTPAAGASALTNRLPNANFSAFSSSGGHDVPTSWTVFAGDPDLYGSGHAFAGPDANGESGAWLLLDNPGEGILTTTALANDVIAQDAARYATQFYAALTLFQSDPSGKASVKMSLLAYADSGGTNLLTEQVKEFTVPFSGNNAHVVLDTVFSLNSFPVPVLSYRVRLTGGANDPLGGNSIYCTQPVCFPFAAPVTVSVSGSQVRVEEAQGITYSGGTLTASLPGTLGYGAGAGGLHLRKDYGAGSPQDWSQFNSVALSLGKAAGILGLTLTMTLQSDGGTRYTSNPFAVSADGSVATCDLSTIPAATRAAVRYVELILGGDFTAPQANGDTLLLFGPLTGAGNLSIGRADYRYQVTEINALSDTTNLVNILESSPSKSSAAVAPTLIQAQAAVTAAAAVNAGATHLALYRFGGVFSDGRLIAVVSLTADVAYGADARNPYYSWNHATRTLVDNTPDSYLVDSGVFPVAGAPVVPGRDAPPSGAQAVCFWQGRLWLAKGGRLYGSWLIAQDNQAAMYFTSVNLPGDPLAAVKGAQFAVGQDDNDPILALIPLGTNEFLRAGFLVIIKQHSVWLLSGTDPTSFSLQSFLAGMGDGQRTGIGGIAPLACAHVGNVPWFLSADGIYSFDGSQAQNVSLLIEPLLQLANLNAGAVAGAAMIYHDRRLLLLIPGAGDSANTQVYVYDSRQQGWTHWTGPVAITSGLSLSSQADSNDLYLAGTDGQLYHLSGSVDKPLPTSAGTAITFVVTTRGMGQEAEGAGFYGQRKAVRLYAQVKSAAALPAALGIVTETGATVWGQSFTFNSSGGSETLDAPRLKVPSPTGEYHMVKITGNASAPVTINSLSLELSQGRLSPS